MYLLIVVTLVLAGPQNQNVAPGVGLASDKIGAYKTLEACNSAAKVFQPQIFPQTTLYFVPKCVFVENQTG